MRNGASGNFEIPGSMLRIALEKSFCGRGTKPPSRD
jgi:hypothetical protein